MKKFKEVLAETGPIPGGGQQATFGRYAVGYSPAIISKINAIIGSYVTEDQIDPFKVLYRIRGSLNNLGLTFDQIEEDAMVDSKGSMSLPLTAYGGRFGKDTDGSDLNDDGISHKKSGGLNLEVSYETLKNGASKVYAKLV